MTAHSPRHHALVSVTLAATLTLGSAAIAQTGDDDVRVSAQRRLSTANGLLERGLDDMAEAEYRLFLNGQPNDQDANVARYGLTVSLYRQNRHADALAALTPLESKHRFSFAPDVAMIAAR